MLQRVIGAHDGVATASEPWLLFALLNPLKPVPVRPVHEGGVEEAIADFAATLPGGMPTLEAELREAALRIYGRASPPGTRFYVDKTPHYITIADVIVRVLPDARYVFLTRNPLSMMASMAERFGAGLWSFPGWRRLVLFDFFDRFASAYERHRGIAHLARYEELVSGSEEPWRALTKHIGFDYDPSAGERFRSVELQGRLGDHGGVRFDGLEQARTDAWREMIDDPYRQLFARMYLKRLGRERLALLGHDLDGLLADVRATPVRRPPRPGDLAAAVRQPRLWRDLLRD